MHSLKEHALTTFVFTSTSLYYTSYQTQRRVSSETESRTSVQRSDTALGNRAWCLHPTGG